MKVNAQWVPCVHTSSCSYYFDSFETCIWFGYNTQINFDTFVLQFEQSHFFRHFDNEGEWTLGILCAHFLLQLLFRFI